MGLRAALAQFGAGAPVPVFAVAGLGARDAVQDLRLCAELGWPASPKAPPATRITAAAHNPTVDTAGRSGP